VVEAGRTALLCFASVGLGEQLGALFILISVVVEDRLLNEVSIAFEDVVFEHALGDRSVSEHHLAEAMLDTVLPLALIAAAVGPNHLSEAHSLVFEVLALIRITAGPCEVPPSVLKVMSVLPFVVTDFAAYSCAAPLALPML